VLSRYTKADTSHRSKLPPACPATHQQMARIHPHPHQAWAQAIDSGSWKHQCPRIRLRWQNLFLCYLAATMNLLTSSVLRQRRLSSNTIPANPTSPPSSLPWLPMQYNPCPKALFSPFRPVASAIQETVRVRQANMEGGTLGYFKNPTYRQPYPAQAFIPEDEGLYSKVKTADARYGYEAEVLWNIGEHCEMAISDMHNLASSIQEGDISAITEHSSVLSHYLCNIYSRTLERRDFAEAVENGKPDAILLQKYARLEDKPCESTRYRDVTEFFADLCAKTNAKEITKNEVGSSARPGKLPFKPCNVNRKSGGKDKEGNPTAERAQEIPTSSAMRQHMPPTLRSNTQTSVPFGGGTTRILKFGTASHSLWHTRNPNRNFTAPNTILAAIYPGRLNRSRVAGPRTVGLSHSPHLRGGTETRSRTPSFPRLSDLERLHRH
jgi:hypothetical protein